MQHTNRIKTAVILSAIALFAACKKDSNSNTDQLASLSKATVTGKVFARVVDTIGANSIQYAPSGTVIQAWIDSKDLVVYPATGMPYAKRYYTATVDGSGNYSITVDASKNQAVNVHIEPTSFTHDVVKQTFPRDSIYTTRKVFTPSATPAVSVAPGATEVVDINFL